MAIELIPISIQGRAENYEGPVSELMNEVGDAYAEMASRQPYDEPWIGYFVKDPIKDVIVGSCGFKGSPQESRVEIAYYTFPEFEGKGFATQMARKLVLIAHEHNRHLTIIAHTLREENHSTEILKKIGFKKTAEIDHPEDGPVWEWQLTY